MKFFMSFVKSIVIHSFIGNHVIFVFINFPFSKSLFSMIFFFNQKVKKILLNLKKKEEFFEKTLQKNSDHILFNNKTL